MTIQQLFGVADNEFLFRFWAPCMYDNDGRVMGPPPPIDVLLCRGNTHVTIAFYDSTTLHRLPIDIPVPVHVTLLPNYHVCPSLLNLCMAPPPVGRIYRIPIQIGFCLYYDNQEVICVPPTSNIGVKCHVFENKIVPFQPFQPFQPFFISTKNIVFV